MPGWYYVTLCTKNREMLFGDVVDGEMVLNELGKIAEREWQKTEKIRKNIIIDQYVVMPNHLHGILIIEADLKETSSVETTQPRPAETTWPKPVETTRRVVSTTLAAGSLGSIVGQFKSTCTKRIRREGYRFPGWQPGFYDHIVRVTDSIDTYRDLLSSALDSYLSLQSNKLNQIMKLLTMASIVLMSGALIAGIYGMNFRYMPELDQPWGYPFALGLMAAVSLALIAYFWRKKWF